MRVRAATLAAACLTLALPVRAEDTDQVLRGMAGRYPIVMQIWAQDGGNAGGSYFYTRFKQDIDVRGQAAGGDVSVTSDGTGDRFVLRRDGAGYKGTLTTAKGTELPVRLSPVAKGSVPDPAPDLNLPEMDDYERLRLTGLTFVPGKTETIGSRTIQWYDEPLSKLSMFRVVSGYPAGAMAAINRVLAREQVVQVGYYLNCAGWNGDSGFDASRVSSRFLDDRFVSYAWSGSWFCMGAAHPDIGTAGTTIDARTGKVLALEDILWFGSGAKPAPRTDAWYTYRSDVFAPAAVSLLTTLYPDDMKPTDEVCNFADPSIWSFGPWYFTEQGLHLGAYFARVARACDNPDWPVVPWTELKALNPALFG